MSLVDNGNGNGMIMPVAPMGGYGYGGYGGFDGMFGGNGWWVILFLFAMMGNGFGGWGGFGGNAGALGLDSYLFNTQTQNQLNGRFDTLGLQNQLSAIQQGQANAEVANCNRELTNLQTAYQNQIADMNQRFTLATAVDDRIDNLSMALQKCCCDNELAIANTNANITAQAAENRFQAANNTRDIITNATANTQAVLDKLCQLELDGVRAERDNYRNQLQMANLQASQTAQTAQLMADNNAQTAALINRIAPYPQPSFIVGNPYYSYPYFNNGYNNGCGCGCGNNGNF